jgi:hypothetical protein
MVGRWEKNTAAPGKVPQLVVLYLNAEKIACPPRPA